MSLYRRLRSWSNTPPKLRRLLIEAAWELLHARFTVAFGLRRALPELLVAGSDEDAAPPLDVAAGVRRSVRIAADNVPWKSLCLPNAIAAKRMLGRRGFSSTIHLGVGNRITGDLHAHAWLQAGGNIITGEHDMSGLSQLPGVSSGTRMRPEQNE